LDIKPFANNKSGRGPLPELAGFYIIIFMKVWFKLLIGSILGIVLGILLPQDNARVFEVLAWFERLAINIGRYALIPVLFFSLALGVYKLRQDNRFWGLVLRSFIVMAAGTAIIIVLGISATLLFPPGRVPIQIEEQLSAVTLNVYDNIAGLVPANPLAALAGSGEYILPVCLFAFFLGLGLSYERNYSKTVAVLIDSLSRIFYHVAVFFSEILSLVLIVLSAYWSIRFRAVLAGGKYNDLIVLLGVFSLVMAFGIMPLMLYFVKPKTNPWKVLYGILGPALAGFFSGDINFTLPVLMRHEKENLGVRRRAGSVTLSLFSAFGRAGSAMAAAMAFIVIITSYSSLEVTAADLFSIALRAFGVAFLLAGHPGDGAYTALAVLCSTYDRAGYLILKPLAFYLIACGAFLDIMFSAFASYALARMSGFQEDKNLQSYI
jgi:Na+/H+-dicarboxylate symporter